MCQRSHGRRREINQVLRRHMPISSYGQKNYFDFISVIQDRSDLLSHRSCRGLDGCGSFEDVLKRLLIIFRLRRHSLRGIHDWNPIADQSVHQQYCDFVGHLFTRYEVPAWMLKSSSEVDLRALIRVGGGGSLRTAWPNIRLSKSMARALWQVPSHLSRAEAFAWAEIKTLGGSDSLAKTLCNCPNLMHSEPEFRTSLMRFFVRCERDATTPLLNSEILPAIKFIHAIKFLPARTLLGLQISPYAGPLCPEFVLEGAGRDLRWLRRRMANWEEELVASLGDEMFTKSLDWLASEFSGFDFIDRNNSHWRILELCSGWRLKNEGRKMRHCVASYVNKCSSGKAAIWTVRKTNLKSNSTTVMATIEVNSRSRMIVQIKAKCNAPPSDATMQVIRRWAESADLDIAEAV